MTSFEHRTADVAGCTIHYREAGSGSPLIFLHGGGGVRVDEETWAGLAEHYRLLVPSLPGFDESTPGTTSSIEDVADVTAEFIRAIAGGSTAVVGESFGGMVAAWTAIRHPEVVTHLVLAAPAGLRQAGGPLLQQLTPAEISEMLFGRPPTAPPDPAQVERAQRARQTVARLMQNHAQFDHRFKEELAKVQAPTLLVWGTADRMTWPTQAKHFEERIPRSRLVLIEGGPHALAAAVPREFLEAVLPFLAGAAIAA